MNTPWLRWFIIATTLKVAWSVMSAEVDTTRGRLMTCWRCSNRDEYSEFGLCKQCREELDAEIPYPPPDNATLHPKGTLPEEIGPYRIPVPSDYKTSPIEVPYT